MEVLTQLLQFGDDHSNDASWIRDVVDQYMLDKGQFEIESLEDDQINEVVEVIKKTFSEKEIDLPDYLKTDGELSVDPVDADKVEKLESQLAERDSQLANANKKLEVAKSFIRQLDSRVSKMESVAAEDLVTLLADYESIGTPEDIQAAIDQIPELKAKVEELLASADDTKEGPKEEVDPNNSTETSPKVESPESSTTEEDGSTTSSEESSECSGDKSDTNSGESGAPNDPDKSVLSQQKDEGENMNDNENNTEADKVAAAAADQAELLKRYQELGTPEELAELVEKASKVVDNNSELTEKVESMTSRLAKYESIGEPEEVAEVVEQYGQLKIDQEADRIAADLGIPKERVLSTIDRMGSVAAAEEMLAELFPKTSTESTESKTENETEEKSDVQPTDGSGPELIEKTESARVLPGRADKSQPKNESAAASQSRLDNLRKICDRL